MNIRIYFDGIEQNLNDFDGTESIAISFRRETSDGESGLSFAPELECVGGAFSYLYTNLIDKPNPNLETVLVTVFDTCCLNDDGTDRLIFTGQIKGANVRWCETESGVDRCSMTVTVLDNSADAIALTCLKNIFPWDRKPKADGSGTSDGFFAYRQPALISYCIDIRPGFLQEIVLIFGWLMIFMFSPIIVTVGVILTILRAIIAVLLLPFTTLPNINYVDDALDLIATLTQIIVGCGRKHAAPFVHSYLTNMCDICGLGLSSSIFEPGGDYHNTVRMDAAFRPGSRTRNGAFNTFFLYNKPNINGTQFLDAFKQFNITWKVSDGILYVERKDFESGNVWFNTSLIPDSYIIEKCFEPVDQSPFAFAEYEYAKDGIDNTGDEAAPDWTQTVIDWNVPPNPAQSGLFSRTFSFSAAQFRKDAARDDVSALDKGFYAAFFPSLNRYDHVMLMERGICGFPRLLQIDPNSDLDDARVQKYPSAAANGLFDYNIDWWVKESYTDGNNVPRETLYNRFLYLDDPRTTGVKTRNYTIVLNADCDLIKNINLDSVVKIEQGGSLYDGTVENIDYDITKNTITINGKI